MLGQLQLLRHLLDVLDVVLARHQQRVGRVDDHQSIDADCRDHAGVALHVAVAAVHEHRLALVPDCPIASGGGQLAHRLPGAHVAPVEGGRHDGHA